MPKLTDGEMIGTAHLRRVEIWRAVCEIIATAFNRLAAHDEEIKRLRWQVQDLKDRLGIAIYGEYDESAQTELIVTRLEAIVALYQMNAENKGGKDERSNSTT